jgi:hypothetical protein
MKPSPSEHPAQQLKFDPMTEARKENPIWTGVAALGFGLALVGVAVRPFLFATSGALLFLIGSKMMASPRFTRPGAIVVALCAFAGAAIAAAFKHALY